MGEVLTIAVPVIISLVGGGGGVWAFYQARVSKQLGVRQNDIEASANATTGFRDLVTALTTEVGRLREDRDEDRARIVDLTRAQDIDRESQRKAMADLLARYDVLADENRRFRDVILSVMEQLRRTPPPPHGEILTYILRYLPGLGKETNERSGQE